MNNKAAKFNEFLKANMPNIFQVQDMPEAELHPVLFQTAMEIDKQNLPMMMVIDDSIYVMFQVRLANAVVNEKNRKAIMEHLNELNGGYKVFKYYVDEQNSIIIESVILSAEETFTPEVVQACIQVVYEHLQEEYKNIMRLVWSN